MASKSRSDKTVGHGSPLHPVLVGLSGTNPRNLGVTPLDRGMKAKNLAGTRIGILTVSHDTGKTKYKKPSKVWHCVCDCGQTKEYSTAELLGSVLSCGCLRKQNMERFKTANIGKPPKCTLPLGESTKNCILASYKNSATKRGIDFDLSETEFKSLILSNCHYCGSPPSQIKTDRKRAGGSIVYTGIDRMDNTQGYKASNCVPCCSVCNRAKDVMSIKDFSDWIRRVSQRSTYWEPQASSSNEN